MSRNDEAAARVGGAVAGTAATAGRTEFAFDSADGKSQVRAVLWVPLTMERTDSASGEPELGCFKPRGVVQLIHGMAEHIDRYDDFARFLADAGYLVAGHDHIGHGDTAGAPERRGVIDAEGGADAMIEDAQMLRLLVSQQVASGTPYFIFGHSMGSLVLRSYLPRYGSGLAGAIICGTANEPVAVSRAGNLAARAIARVRGDDYRSKLLDGMGVGAFAKQIENPRTPHDWVCTDPAVVDAYIADELCGAMFSVGGYATLTDLTGEVVSPSCAAKVPKGLPVLFVAGAEDPVGACGKGVRAAADLLRRAGVRDVEVKLYEGMRHEILNEPGRAQVYTEVVGWIEEHACQSTS